MPPSREAFLVKPPTVKIPKKHFSHLFKQIFEDVSQLGLVLRAGQGQVAANPDHRHLLLHLGQVDRLDVGVNLEKNNSKSSFDKEGQRKNWTPRAPVWFQEEEDCVLRQKHF